METLGGGHRQDAPAGGIDHEVWPVASVNIMITRDLPRTERLLRALFMSQDEEAESA